MKAKRILSCAAGLVLAATGAASAQEPAPAERETPPEVEPSQPSEPADQPPELDPTDPTEQPPPAHELSAVSFDALDRTKRQELQSRLAERGFYDGPIDGQIDEPTREALSEFQQSQGIEATGHLDAATSQALGLGVFVDPDEAEPMVEPGIDESGMHPQRGAERPQRAPEREQPDIERDQPAERQSEQPTRLPEADDSATEAGPDPLSRPRDLSRQEIEDIQAELRELGYYDAAVDGIYGPRTRRAVEEFQRDRGLDTTGELDAQTLQELEQQPGGEEL